MYASSDPAETLDFGRPAAILLMATLVFVLDDALAAEIMRSLVAAVLAGSHVALYHRAMSGRQITLRSRAELAGLLAGLDPVPPGLVPVTEWRPEAAGPLFQYAVAVYGAAGRKP